MASVFAHGVLAYSLSKLETTPFSISVVVTGVVLSIFPDVDVLTFLAGIPYESVWGHRGITHSIVFAILTASIMTYWLSIRRSNDSTKITATFIYLFLCTASHGFLDAMTTGGKGVGFFIPISPERYFFDQRPILVSPIGIDSFFSSWGLAVLKSEVKTVGVISLFILATGSLKRRLQRSVT